MKWVVLLFFFSALAFGSGLYFGYRGLYQMVGSTHTSHITVAGFLLASAGWLFNNAVTLRVSIRNQSLKYLESIGTRVLQSRRLNRLWIDNKIDEMIANYETKRKFFYGEMLISEVIILISDIANAYEEMAVAMKSGAVEKRMLQSVHATNLRWFWTKLEPFLAFYRNQDARLDSPYGRDESPKVFSHCEELAKKWRNREI